METGPSPGRVTLGVCGIIIIETTCLQGWERLDPKGTFEEPDDPALSHGTLDEDQAFPVSLAPEGSPGCTGTPGVIVDTSWRSLGKMRSGVLGVSRDMFSLFPSDLVMESQVGFPGPQQRVSKAEPGNISQTLSRTSGIPGPSAAGSHGSRSSPSGGRRAPSVPCSWGSSVQ